MLAYLKLEMLRMLRNRRYVILSVALPVGFFLLFSQMYGTGATENGTPVTTYIMIARAAFGALGSSLNIGGARLAEERASGWTRQLRVMPLPPASYLIAKVLSAIALAVPVLVLIGFCGVVIEHVHLPLSTWAASFVLLAIGTLPFAALGIFLGSIFDVDSAQGGTILAYMLLSLLGGLWFPVESMPSTLRLLAKLTPSFHYADIAWSLAGGDNIGAIDLLVLVAYLIAFGALAIWAYRRDEARQAA
jgi:ABC-2 type transport system permease protein